MNAEAADNKLAKREPQQMNLSNGIFFDPGAWDAAVNVAHKISKSGMIPATFKGHPENIIIALDFAARAKISPLAVMQGMYIVSGKPAFSGQFTIGLANQQGKISALDYKMKKNSKGEIASCTASAILGSTGNRVETTITAAMVKAEGWERNAKWKTMPEHMFKLRAGAWLVREYCPEVAMGLPTPEEVEDSTDDVPKWDADGVVITDEELAGGGSETPEESTPEPSDVFEENEPRSDLEGEATAPPEDNGTPTETEPEAEESAEDIFGGKF